MHRAIGVGGVVGIHHPNTAAVVLGIGDGSRWQALVLVRGLPVWWLHGHVGMSWGPPYVAGHADAASGAGE